MSILIDGYNLLNSVGIAGTAGGRGSLERSRTALLNFLAETLDPAEIPQTAVVFDAANPPPGRPRSLDHRGLRVYFASQYEDADSMIEELILADSVPRRLTVVSSDHRVQRAARRRRARAVDSDVWFMEAIRGRQERQQAAARPSPVRPSAPVLDKEVEYWLRQFSGAPELETLAEEETAAESPAPATGAAESHRTGDKTTTHDDRLSDEEAQAIGNPFPPGYGEDLLEPQPLDDPSNPFPPGYGEDLEE
jgi:predicted RNA-binding protein with PIN domain